MKEKERGILVDNWNNILDENILKFNINFAAVFVMSYECLKEFVVEQIRFFYSEHIWFEDDKLKCEESVAYKEKVRKLDRNIENASLKWFIDAGAITQEDYDIYQIIRIKRNDITHELLKNINCGFGEEDVHLFENMLRIYNKLDKWWINEIEIPIAADDIPEDYDREMVVGGQAFILLIINDIIFANRGEEYKELLRKINEIGVSKFV